MRTTSSFCHIAFLPLPSTHVFLHYHIKLSLILFSAQIHPRGCQQTLKHQSNLDRNVLKLPSVASFVFPIENHWPFPCNSTNILVLNSLTHTLETHTLTHRLTDSDFSIHPERNYNHKCCLLIAPLWLSFATGR